MVMGKSRVSMRVKLFNLGLNSVVVTAGVRSVAVAAAVTSLTFCINWKCIYRLFINELSLLSRRRKYLMPPHLCQTCYREKKKESSCGEQRQVISPLALAFESLLRRHQHTFG
jgi:hypothetical protein